MDKGIVFYSNQVIQNYLCHYQIPTKNNDVSNQQDATIFRLLIFLNQPYMFRATNSPILRSTFWLYIHLSVQCTDTAADRHQRRCFVPKAVNTVKKCSWGCANLSPEICRAINKRKGCWILLVAYIVVQWCTVTQTSSSHQENYVRELIRSSQRPIIY